VLTTRIKKNSCLIIFSVLKFITDECIEKNYK
jgi:hypothetical protein